MPKTIKSTLVEAGRYEDVMKLLEETRNVSGPNCPVVCHNDGTGHVCYDVYPEGVKLGAERIIRLINSDAHRFPFSDDLDSLYWYIHTMAEHAMINYAVSVSHGHVPNDVSVENIRVCLILRNLIEANDIDDTDWYIPEGWKCSSREV